MEIYNNIKQMNLYVGLIGLIWVSLIQAAPATLKVYCEGPTTEGRGYPSIFMIYSPTSNLAQLDILCRSDGRPSAQTSSILDRCDITQCTTQAPTLYFVDVMTLPLTTTIAVGVTSATQTYPGTSDHPIKLAECLDMNVSSPHGARVDCFPTLTQDSLACLHQNLEIIPQNQLCISDWSYFIGGALGLSALILGLCLWRLFSNYDVDECCATELDHPIYEDEDFTLA
jgi:hypothetical protein